LGGFPAPGQRLLRLALALGRPIGYTLQAIETHLTHVRSEAEAARIPRTPERT